MQEQGPRNWEGDTFIGGRGNNEDAYGTRVPSDLEVRTAKGSLYVVADGMGGHAAGQVASRVAVETLIKAYYDSDAEPQEALVEAVQRAREEIRNTALEHGPAWEEMGCTTVACVVLDRNAIVAHVGDSRAYYVDPQGLHRLTRDHLYVVEKLGIAEAEARQHPEGHRLSRALDASQKELEVAWSELSLWPGGRFLLCTDGLTDVVADEEIHEALTSASPGEAVERLLQAAEREKTPDNATVIVVFVPEETPWSEAPREEREEALESASPEVAPWEQNPDEVETAPPPEVTDEVSPETAAPLETPPAANDHGLARLGQWVRSLVGKS